MKIMEQTYVYSKIIKQEKQVDGTLLVTGIATDDSLDVDQQICDPAWLSKAMPEWFRWGNIREQHSNIAAGVATEYKAEGSQHIITARVVDPSSVKKVESGVLKGFSIGIRAPRVIRDNKADGGRIVDGTIVEVSLVDRPANPTCLLSLAKSVDGEIKQVEELIEAKADDMDEKMCDKCGMTMAADDQVCKNCEGLDGKAAYKTCDKCGKPMGMDDKMCKYCDGLGGKAAEESSQAVGEESSQEIGEESSRVGGVAGVAGKANESTVEETTESTTVPEDTNEITGNKKKSKKKQLKSMRKDLKEIKKTLNALLSSYETGLVKAPTEDIAKSVAEVTERMSKVEKSASRGPVRVVAQKTVTTVSENELKAQEYRGKAACATDPVLAQGYLMLAAEIETQPTL